MAQEKNPGFSNRFQIQAAGFSSPQHPSTHCVSNIQLVSLEGSLLPPCPGLREANLLYLEVIPKEKTWSMLMETGAYYIDYWIISHS